MITDDGSETVIIETLRTLQQLFKKTIYEYNKISSQLINSSDNIVIYKLWQDYLDHVKSFLHTSVPTDYNVLKEQLHLCKIHQNLLNNQKSALMHKICVDPIVPDDFETFKNTHIDLLKELYDRQLEVERRIEMWEKYRTKQLVILEQIDDIEREKSVLQLKQLYLKSVPKLKQQITDILERVTNVEGAIGSVKKHQPNLLNFIDDITSNSIRLEYSATSQRLSNIRASLETWDGFLNRIQELHDNYEQSTKVIQTNNQQHIHFLESIKKDIHSDFHNSKNHLVALREKQALLNKTKADLEVLDTFKEELKDYVSIYDIKMIRQTIWILWQQYTDLNHEYSVLINQIEERHCLQTEFVIRYENLMMWLNETENRLMDTIQKHDASGYDDDMYMKHYANNLLEEFSLKEYDKKWITSVGNDLLMYYSSDQQYDSPEKIDIECKIANMNTKWNNVKQMYESKTRKFIEIKTTYFNLESRISEIRKWLFETEKELLKPFVFESTSQKSFDALLADYEKLKRSVENRSSNVAEVLNLSELMLSELRNYEMDFNIRNLDMAVSNIECRWKKLCETLVQRKQSLFSIRSKLEEIERITKENKDWVIECDNICNQYENASGKLNREHCDKDIDYLNDSLTKLSIQEPIFQILEKQYNSLMTANIDIENLKNLTTDSRRLLIILKTLIIKITTVRTLLKQYLTDFEQFSNLHENIILNLTQIDVELTNIEHLKLYENEDEEIMKINKARVDLQSAKNMIDSADALRVFLVGKSDEGETLKLKEMSDEYTKLYNTIKTNYDNVAAKYPDLVGKEPVMERDFAVQVNTLQTQSSVSPKDAYIYEILSAITEFRTNIEKLEGCVSDVENLESGLIPKSVSSKVTKNIAACESSLELIRYLNSLLIKEYNCTDKDAHTDEINNLYARFQLSLELWNSKKTQSTQAFSEQ